ncbi:MAG: 3-dehydroquinate synthase [Gammaproteobacteria bacterium]|nr:3-dehydroquinate synthase [Gammaproteobacteria bacterium]
MNKNFFLNVELGARSYPILIGSGLLREAGLLDPYVNGRDVLIVTNDQLVPLYLQAAEQLTSKSRVQTLVLPEGESAKTLDTLNLIFDALVEHRYGRDCVLIALGGGVIGDITGFAAASWQRGVDFIQIPTTLLAQVDSSVGGKTAVNHPGGKNLIGAFHQPLCVVSDMDTLHSLPERELGAGLAEVIKYGLLGDAEFFGWLEQEYAGLLQQDKERLQHVVRRSCELKAQIVAADEREHGRRALLNLGHTFGHAIERCAGYGEWLHGEAVAAGMCMAAAFSERIGWLDAASVERTRALVSAFGLPVAPPQVSPTDFLAAMSLDKKVIAGQIRLVLLRGIGRAEVTADYAEHELVQFLSEQFVS